MATRGEQHLDMDQHIAEIARLAWHDATCPEGDDCPQRDMHPRSSLTVDAISKVVEAVLPWAQLVLHERARLAKIAACIHTFGVTWDGDHPGPWCRDCGADLTDDDLRALGYGVAKQSDGSVRVWRKGGF